MKSAGNSFILKLSETPPVTVDLPGSGGVPAKIETTGEMVAVANIYVAADFYMTIAKTDAVGATRITSDTTRGKFPAGFYNFEVSALHEDNIYIVSQAVGATTDGIAYCLSEFA